MRTKSGKAKHMGLTPKHHASRKRVSPNKRPVIVMVIGMRPKSKHK